MAARPLVAPMAAAPAPATFGNCRRLKPFADSAASSLRFLVTMVPSSVNGLPSLELFLNGLNRCRTVLVTTVISQRNKCQ